MTQSSRPQADHISNYPLPSDPGPYTADQWAQYMQIVYTGDQQSSQGPLIRYLNELIVTTNATTEIYVNTGAGMVNGHLLVSSESETFVIPAGPVATRIDIVAMVENNTNAEITATDAARPFLFPNDLSEYTATPAIPAYSARLVIVRGADGAGAPVLDQTTAKYMVELARYTINNVPTISALTDNRVFCRFSNQQGPIVKRFLAPFIHGWDVTAGTPIVVDANYVKGMPLIDANDGYLTAKFSVPDDFISGMTVSPILVEPAAGVGGNVRLEENVLYGTCSEVLGVHTDPSGFVLVATGVGSLILCPAGLTVALTAEALGDHVSVVLNRTGGHAGDTAILTMYALGALVEYTGWEGA